MLDPLLSLEKLELLDLVAENQWFPQCGRIQFLMIIPMLFPELSDHAHIFGFVQEPEDRDQGDLRQAFLRRALAL